MTLIILALLFGAILIYVLFVETKAPPSQPDNSDGDRQGPASNRQRGPWSGLDDNDKE